VLTKYQLAALRRHRVSGRNRLGRALELSGLTQEQVAARTGFTQSYISRIKQGRYSDLPGETMRTFSVLFGCAIEDLFPSRVAVAS
jgi:transcriptional regulator with XRE-family HTH domain